MYATRLPKNLNTWDFQTHEKIYDEIFTGLHSGAMWLDQARDTKINRYKLLQLEK